MNDFFYESRGKEKIKELRNEGQVSQSFYRSRSPKPGLAPSVSRLVLGVLGILGLLGLLVR
jgi:hypothetical protein